jgi:16S rRNA (adenine1518-N6/adenine1519-N6)-dimethyltransferase
MKERGFAPKKFFGQNFLISDNILNKIILASGVSRNDTVLEIGPGLGFLTEKLAENAGKVIAVEKDRELAGYLKEIFSEKKEVEIIEGDILKLMDKESFLGGLGEYKIVANLPYYITSHFLRMVLESKNPPKEMFLMLQKEVAQRICAKPPKTSLLSVAVQFYGRPKVVFKVKSSFFWPEPKIDSAILGVSDIKRPPNIDHDDFFKLAKAGFSQKRKLLLNNLKNGLKKPSSELHALFTECGISPSARAENLTIENWLCLNKKPSASNDAKTAK